MRALLESPPAPDARSGQSGGTADPAGEPRGWRALAVALAGLLAQSDRARVSDAQRHESEIASQRAAHDRDLLQDREAFLGVVAHELKTPAAVIKAYAELLDAQLADASTPPSTLREVVANIRDQADLMSGLIEGVLDMQRLRLGKLPLQISRIDLVQLARTVANQVQQTTPEHVIRVVAPDPPPPLLADRARVRQVLANLLENAVKYSAGGEIEIRISRGRRNGRDCAIVAIRDEGAGIDPENLDRIFDLFQQGSGAPVRGHVGLGLGLYVARQVARAHRGDVWADSRGKGQGSTFYLALPLDFASPP
jgi:signal transduction histidine kinase